MSSYYDILKVAPDAEDFVVEAAYKALLKRNHPDVAGGDRAAAEARTKAITEAYRVLRDPGSRAQYDRERPRARGPGSYGRPPPGRPASSARWSQARCGAVAERRGGSLASWLFAGLVALVLTSAVGSFAGWGRGASKPTPVGARAQTQADVIHYPVVKLPFAKPYRLGGAPLAASQAKGDHVGANLDCRAATTEVLRLICSTPQLARADAVLAARYHEAQAKAADPAAIRNDQRQWLARRNAAPAETGRLAALYDERLGELTRAIDPEDPPY